MDSASNPTVTTTALLDALRDGRDTCAWEEFDRRYRPVIFHLALRMGLTEPDAADVAQESLLAFFRDHGAGRYERGRGRLRAYLLGIARHRALDALTLRRRGTRVGGDTVIRSLAFEGVEELEAAWEAELQAEILRRAFALLSRTSGMQDKSLAMFHEYALRGDPVEEVALRHGVSSATVYAVKSRCLERLVELRAELSAAYEDL